MILVIAEKPSVAQTIAAALGAKKKQDGYIEGNGYLISWCVGHLVQLADAAAYGEQYKKWSYDSLPILPEEWQYTVAADKGKQFKILKELMHRDDVSEVVNGCDAGREGELIFRFVYHMAGCNKPMRRLWISSMEESAIKEGFASLKDGRDYDTLFASALCRAKADWIIGINATRLFSCLYNRTLNVGRVQTPTLKMLVDRDAAISTFKKEKYYHVRLSLSGAEAASGKICAAEEAAALKTAYWLYPSVTNEEEYGYYLIDELDELELPEEAKKYFMYEDFGRDAAINDGGRFTEQGYIYNKSDTFDMWGAVGLIRDDERRDNTEREISVFHSRHWHVCRHNPYIGIMILPYRHSPSVRSVADNG